MEPARSRYRESRRRDVGQFLRHPVHRQGAGSRAGRIGREGPV